MPEPVPETADGRGELVDGGRYLLIDGRRWRATDPGIPEKLRAELVAELMAARRMVRTDPDSARPRVHDAKVALGERGPAWWETPDEAAQRERIVATVRTLLRHRNGKTVCPSDIARIVGGDQWRDRMGLVRAVVAGLRGDEVVIATQRGGEIDPLTARGPIRIAPGPRL